MKKSILFITLFSGVYLNLHAQNYLINQDFSSTTGKTLPSGWTNNMITGVTGDDEWVFGKHPKFFFAPPLDDKYAIFDSYNGGSTGGTATNGQAETVALESPSVNTTGLSNLNLSFDYMNLGNGGTAFLEISVDGGSNWTSYTSYSSVTSTPVSVLYNFSSYVGYSAFKIRIRWYNASTANYQGYIAIDNLKLFSRYTTDATITGLNPMYDKSCPSSSQAVNIVLKNEGINSISNVPVVVNVTGAASATLNYTYTGTIASGASVDVNVGSINTTTGGTVNFSAVVNYSGDGYSANNTYTTQRVSASIAGNPTAIDGSACARGSRVSIGVSKSAGDSTFWYDQASGGSIIAEGNPFLTPPLNASTTFYAQNARLFNNDQWGFQGPYRFNGIQYSGSYFDIKAANEILIDSFWQHFAYSGNYDVYIYYKSGTYSGFESNSSAWTMHQKISITSSGFGHMVGLKLTKPLNVPSGSLYGFYILVDGLASNKCITFKSGTLSFSNADLTVSAGSVSNNQFTGVSGYSWDGRVFYRKLCLSSRVAVQATIKPSPTGASLVAGTPFQGKFNSGSFGSPDVIELNQTNSYEFTPPTGYSNANHTTKWKINSLTLITSGGYTIPVTDYTYSAPTGGGANAKVSIKALSKYMDSNIVITFNFSDMGPYYCDSTVKRIVRVVPTPKPNFIFTKPACDGTPIVFENKSTIHSGNMVYQWYYGDGDSIDYESPIHVYPTFGTYCVKLVATSLPYMIKHDTTICISISEIPKISFKVTNACEGKNVSFTNLTTIGTGTLAFDWDFGDATAHSSVKDPTHLYSVAGSYQVTLKATSNTNCVSTLTKNANQFVRPKADFTTKGNCSNTEIEFINLSKIGAGDNFGSHWLFGDGELNNERDPLHIYITGGTKTVKFVATSQFGCTDSITKNIDILSSPDASFKTGQVCNIDPVEFNNTTFEPLGVLVSYTWDFGDGKTSNLKNPKHPYPDLGYRTVVLKANGNNGCNTSFSKTIKVLLQPVASFSANDACAGTSVIFSNKTKGGGTITYRWKFGDGDSSKLFMPTKKYATTIATTYNVTLTATILGGCQNSISIPVTIKETPKCSFKFASAGTGGYEYKFTPTVATYPFYQWSFEGGGISNASSPVHRFPLNGIYRVRVMMKTVDGCDCMDSSQFVNVNNLGVKTFDATSGISFYPNPNKGEFNLQVSTVSPTEPFTLNILDLTGRLINTSILIGDTPHAISYTELANGLYTLEIIKQSGDRVTAKMNVIK